MGAGYGVMVCRKRGLDGVLIGRWDAQQHLRREGGGGWAVSWQSDYEGEEKKKLAGFASPYMQLQHGS
jgi:hypothetical protein